MVGKGQSPIGGATLRRPTLRGSLSLLQIGTILLLTGLSLTTLGCASSPQKPPETAPKQARVERQDQKQQDQPTYEHVAPPPAYGNRVVMAEEKREFTNAF